jgi:hypothetical protein
MRSSAKRATQATGNHQGLQNGSTNPLQASTEPRVTAVEAEMRPRYPKKTGDDIMLPAAGI